MRWRKENAESESVRQGMWRINNSQRRDASRYNSRAKTRGFTDSIPIDELCLLIDLMPHCAYCGSIHNRSLDHKVSRANGGSHMIENVQMLCRKCNVLKKDENDEDYRQRNGIPRMTQWEIDWLSRGL